MFTEVETADSLLEMAAVICTIFGVRVEADQASPAPALAAVVTTAPEQSVTPAPVTVAPAAVPAPPAGLPVPGLAPAPTIPVPAVGLDDTTAAVTSKASALSIPVPALAEPVPAASYADAISGTTATTGSPEPELHEHDQQHEDDPHERHSMALLQEIAFLDD